MPETPLHPDHDALRDLLTEAGRFALSHRDDTRVERKPDGSLVSDVDRTLDARIAAGLRERFPGTGVRGEEGAHQTGEAGTFFVDPVDGTHAFLQGLAYWGPTVGLVRDDELVLGALYLPVLDQFFFAARGHGAWRNGEPLPGPDRRQRTGDRVLFAPSRIHDAPAGLWDGKVRVLGSTAAHLALVASGAGSATLVPSWNLWDVGCGALLISESGGSLCGLDGGPVDLVRGPPGLPFLAGASTALSDVVTAVRHQQESSSDARP